VGGGVADSDVDYVAVEDSLESDKWRGCHADVWALADDDERQRAVTLLGKPVDLSNDALENDIDVWSSWQQEIALVIGSSDSEGDALARLSEWQRSRADDESIAASLYRTALQADMAGQLFVRVVEAPETLPRSMRALDDSPRPSFLTLPFEEAIQAFLEKQIVTPEEFRALSDAARQRAFTATNLSSRGLVERAYRRLLESLQSGSTLQDFQRALQEDSVSLGVTRGNSGYLENVYRTNVGSSYSAGRYRQMLAPSVVEARPYVQYRATMDSRTTNICSALNGLMFSQSDATWRHLAPTNHYQCRSVMVVRRDLGGKRVTLGSDVRERPEPGFDAPPALDLTA